MKISKKGSMGLFYTRKSVTVFFVGMFMFLSFLENSGYMMRAAFVMDRLMRALGLPGKSFVPMIVGFGCNVPAVMGARTLSNPRDRVEESCSRRYAARETLHERRGGADHAVVATHRTRSQAGSTRS